ncbi:MAG: hypothetical protein Q7T73_06785, partial [Beijerinckiaceae bacterium]|nr:hypothetical protein [Beijerinckiaceae bacterium]
GTFQKWTSVGSTFRHCHFDDLRVEDLSPGSGHVPSHFVDCTFDRSVLRAPALGKAHFIRCSFRDVRLQRWNTVGDFVDCVFTGRGERCAFHGAERSFDTNEVIRRADFRGNDFSGMTFRDVSFRDDINLRLQRLPNGEDDLYIRDAALRIGQARRRLLAFDDQAVRDELTLILNVIHREVDLHHQTDVFIRASDLATDAQMRQQLIVMLGA